MDLQDKASQGYVLGYIKSHNQSNAYLMPIAYWILNYKKYDPSYNPKDWNAQFRNNILSVNDNNVDDYIAAIEVDKVNAKESEVFDFFEVRFYIDFIEKFYISNFVEIAIDDYLPDARWKFQLR